MKTDTPVAIAKAFDYPTLTPIDRPILTPPNGHKKSAAALMLCPLFR